MKLDIMEIVKRSWDITWKYKYLWFLGFLVSLTGGSSNLSNSFRSSTNSGSTSGSANTFSNFASAYLFLIIIAGLVLTVVFTAFAIISIIAQGGLIGAAAKIERNEPTSLKDAFGIGARNFWRLFGLSILIGLVIITLIIIMAAVIGILAVVFFSGGNQNMLAPGLACVIPLGIVFFVILIGVIILLALISNYATRYIVAGQMGVMESIRHGYALIKARWVDTLVMYLVLAVIGAVAGGILAIPSIAIAIPAALAVAAATAANNIGLAALGMLGLLFAGLVGAVFGSVVAAYTSVAWTITYLRLTGTTE